MPWPIEKNEIGQIELGELDLVRLISDDQKPVVQVVLYEYDWRKVYPAIDMMAPTSPYTLSFSGPLGEPWIFQPSKLHHPEWIRALWIGFNLGNMPEIPVEEWLSLKGMEEVQLPPDVPLAYIPWDRVTNRITYICGKDEPKRLWATNRELRDLKLHSFRSNDMHPLAALTGLRRLLVVSRSLKSTRGIESLQNLEHAWFAAGALEDISALASLEQLSFLSLDGKLSNLDISGITTSQSLRHLHVEQLESLEILDRMPNLESISWQSLRSKDTSPLLRHTKIQETRTLGINLRPKF